LTYLAFADHIAAHKFRDLAVTAHTGDFQPSRKNAGQLLPVGHRLYRRTIAHHVRMSVGEYDDVAGTKLEAPAFLHFDPGRAFG
jgi:hypothetical protein